MLSKANIPNPSEEKLTKSTKAEKRIADAKALALQARRAELEEIVAKHNAKKAEEAAKEAKEAEDKRKAEDESKKVIASEQEKEIDGLVMPASVDAVETESVDAASTEENLGGAFDIIAAMSTNAEAELSQAATGGRTWTQWFFGGGES